MWDSDKRDSESLCSGQRWSLVGGSCSGFEGERHMSAPPGALWDAPRGNARWGGSGMAESPHVGVVVSVEEECAIACINYWYWFVFNTGRMTPSADGRVRGFTLISGLCCCRHRTAALQPRPPELNASHTWERDTRRADFSHANSRLLDNYWMDSLETEYR